MDEFETPEGLGIAAQEAIRTIMRVVRECTALPSTGGARAFYSPEEWKQRGEAYGRTSLLIITHDGGDLAPYFNMDYGCYNMYEYMQRELAKVGVYVEMCTNWYSAIYVL